MTHWFHSEFKGENISTAKYKGTFPCGHCGDFHYMDARKNITLLNGETFQPKNYVNCRTPGVVYLLCCQCGCYYVLLCDQHREERSFPTSWKTYCSSLVHGDVTPKVRFLALDHIYVNPRGGDFNKLLLQSELRWIFHLKATTAPGLNEAFNFKPYLSGFESGVCELDLWLKMSILLSTLLIQALSQSNGYSFTISYIY